jgi:hypothetical protein
VTKPLLYYYIKRNEVAAQHDSALNVHGEGKMVEFTDHVITGEEYFFKNVTIHISSIKVQGYLRHKMYLLAHLNALKCKRPD